MSAIAVQTPFKVFKDVDGDPLEAGYIYVGEPDLDPITNPIAVFFDKELSVPAPQPIRTLNGYASRSGSPSNIFISEVEYSITIKNKNESLVHTSLNASSDLGTAAFFNVGTEAGTLVEKEDIDTQIAGLAVVKDTALEQTLLSDLNLADYKKYKVQTGVFSAGGGLTYMARNAYLELGVWKYLTDGEASVITITDGGVFTFYSAISGLEGENITLVERLKSDSTGSYINEVLAATTEYADESSKKVLLETRTTVGAWTISDLEIGKPLLIKYVRTGTVVAYAQYNVTAGVTPIPNATIPNSIGKSSGQMEDAEFTEIPTSTSVTINLTLFNSGMSLQAFQ